MVLSLEILCKYRDSYWCQTIPTYGALQQHNQHHFTAEKKHGFCITYPEDNITPKFTISLRIDWCQTIPTYGALQQHNQHHFTAEKKHGFCITYPEDNITPKFTINLRLERQLFCHSFSHLSKLSHLSHLHLHI